MADISFRDKTRKKFKRQLRRRRKAVEEFGQQADQNIDKLLLRRLNRLTLVRRFVALWIVLFGLFILSGISQLRELSPYYQSLHPVSGGIHSEGVVGSFTNSNPLYANGAADTSVSHLVFSGLLKYDQKGSLIGDLATSWKADAKQTRYILNLRQGVLWQDGKPFTSADVVFTYKTIQNTEAQSPLFSSWRDINVSASGSYRVIFDLPNPLVSFPYTLINGIIPKHLLASVPVAQLRSADFNTNPIGTGPFRLRFISVGGSTDTNIEQQITLAPYSDYWAGRPKLDGFNLSVYRSDQQLINAFARKRINAMSGLDSVPSNLASTHGLQFYNTPLNAIVMAFFNNSRPVLNDKLVRQALVSAVDRQQLVSLMSYPPTLINGPLLPGQAKYDSSTKQLPYDLKLAKHLLNESGWKIGAGGQRYKNGKPLTISLISQNTQNYIATAQFLQQQWSRLGIKIVVTNSPATDLQGSVIPNHDYDILLYGIDVGVDPDVFAYWDSSQASINSQGHLNLSEYKSTIVDQALESARTRSSMSVRAPKYKLFLRTWRSDAPALALYQPTYLYITRGPVFGYQREAIDSAADRFYNVSNWMVREQAKTK